MPLLEICNSGILRGALCCVLVHFDQRECKAGFGWFRVTRGGGRFRQGGCVIHINGEQD